MIERVMLALLLALAVAGCGESLTNVERVPAAITIESTVASIVAGTSLQLDVVVSDARGVALSNVPVTWTSTNENVASVDASGLVRGLLPGTTLIEAEAGGVTDELEIIVNPVPVALLTLTPDSATVEVGRTLHLVATAFDSASGVLRDREMAWVSTDPAVAQADDGVVHGISPGSVEIKASSGGVSGTARIRVTAAPAIRLSATEVTFTASSAGADPSSVTLQIDNAGGGTLGDLAVGAIEYSSGALTGWLTMALSDGVAPATLTLRASTGTLTTGTYNATVPVVGGASNSPQRVHVRFEVTPAVAARIKLTPSTLALFPGDTARLVAIVYDAQDRVLPDQPTEWITSDASVAIANSDGRVLAVGPGNAEITATAGDVRAEAQVAVAPPPVASVAVAPSTAAVEPGSIVQFTATLRDEAGIVLISRDVTWGTSDPGIVTISSTGEARAIEPGRAFITATSEGQIGTARLDVIVPEVARVSIAPSTLSLLPGEAQQLTATVFDAQDRALIDRTVIWSTSDPAIATVGSNGLVTAVGNGSATITATSEGATGEATVAVQPPAVYGVHINTAFELLEGDLVQLQATARDAEGAEISDQAFTYSTSDPSIATISATGAISALAPGTVTFMAATSGATGSVTKTVAGIRVGYGPLPCLDVSVGQTCQTWANVRYAGGSGNIIPGASAQIIYETSNPAVVSITTSKRCTEPNVCSPYVYITGASPGSAIVTATYVAANGITKSDAMPVTVR